MTAPPTHAELVARAARWLRAQGCTVVLTEPPAIRTYESPDAIGWRLGALSILIECKASRADFLRDGKKLQRQPGMGMGQERWFLAPAGLIGPHEVPEGWGLLVPRGRTLRKVVIARKCAAYDKDVSWHELPLLISTLERAQRAGFAIDAGTVVLRETQESTTETQDLPAKTGELTEEGSISQCQ